MLKTAYFTPSWNFANNISIISIIICKQYKRFLKRPKWVHPRAKFTPVWDNACKLPLYV